MRNCRLLGFVAQGAIRQHHALQPLRHVSLGPAAVASPASSRAEPRRAYSDQWRAPPLPSAPGVADRVRSVLRRMPQSVVVVTVAAPPSATQQQQQQQQQQRQAAAADQHHRHHHQHAVGMTVSSFASLDLDGDVAAVAFNVRRPSRTLDAIERGVGVFNVHVLAGNDAGARIARHFTQPNDADGGGSSSSSGGGGGGGGGSGASRDESWPMLRRKPRSLFDDLERRAGCGVVAADSGIDAATAPPVLEGPGVLYVLTCAVPSSPVRGAISVMSHAIVVAGVTGVSVGEVAALEEREEEAAARGRGEAQRTLGLSYGDRKYRAPGSSLLSAAARDEARE
ncbi:hypothetical protein RB594_003957 [Gaeumannomyces avenae]